MSQVNWWIAASSGFVLGLIVGLPYYSLPFFYDYFEATYGWPRSGIVLGLPLGTLVTLVLGPVAARWLRPRGAIVWGSLICGLGLAGLGNSGGAIATYFTAWVVYMAGWTLAGPIMHQILLTQCFAHKRATAIAAAYFGISLFGALSVAFVARPLTASVGFEAALSGIALLVMLAAPVARLGMPDVAAAGQATRANAPWLNRSFWLLLIGSTLSLSGIGGLSQHLKLILREMGHQEQRSLDELHGWVVLISLAAGSAGRFAIARAAEKFDKRKVVGLACVFLIAGIPMLVWAGDPRLAYLFALVFGLGMSADSLMTPLLATDCFGPRLMGSAMGIIGPVNTIGQTWFPFAVTLLWQFTGSYRLSLHVILGLIVAGRLLLMRLPGPGDELRAKGIPV